MNDLLRRILFLPPQRSTVAADIDSLHYLVIIVTMLGATVVALFAAYFMVRYRRRATHLGRPNPGASASPPLKIEAGVLVLLAALFLGFWLIGYRQFLRVSVPPEDSLDVYVMGKQWMWKFAYPHGAASVATLYVPANRPVRLLMTSRDVIHSFYVPDFRIKQDVVPGRYTTTWFEATQPGVYEILCTEYCGTEHSLMRGQVVALAPVDYERWVRSGREVEPKEPPPELPGRLDLAGAMLPFDIDVGERTMVRRGVRAAAQLGCLRCHTLDGTQHIGPTWAGLYGTVIPLQEGGQVLVDDAYLTASMMDPMAAIHLGFPPVMPSYLGRMTPPEVAAIVELIRALRDVEPAPGALEQGIENFGEGVQVQP
ncbi:MAG TPA: cytochrome c oxidase subunit II [Candidatus Nanopelagicales bacterium]|nr:cytochrome c oxidase subunit II [Candidatus Nanopelagicales bacterium]